MPINGAIQASPANANRFSVSRLVAFESEYRQRLRTSMKAMIVYRAERNAVNGYGKVGPCLRIT